MRATDCFSAVMHSWTFTSRLMIPYSLPNSGRFEQLYELVYMGQPDPTADAERELGLVGESEMRERLRDFRMANTDGFDSDARP